MEPILNQIKSEQLSKNPNVHLIDRLKRVLEKGSLSFQDFCGSGTFIPREIYSRDNQQVKLQDDCTDVIRYYGNYIIQGTKSNIFVTEINGVKVEGKSLSILEDMLWSMEVNKVMNK